MSYYLTQLGTGAFAVDLTETYNPRTTPNVKRPAGVRVTATGVAYDIYQGADEPVGVRTITRQGLLVGDDASDLYTQWEYLMDMDGTKQVLERTRKSDGTTHDADVRVRVREGRTRSSNICRVPFILEMTMISNWRGTSRDVSVTGTGSGMGVTLTNAGTLPVTNATITITAGTAALTFNRLLLVSSSIEYDGTIASGTSIVIDTGALTVLNDGSDDIGNVSRGSSATRPEWFYLPPSTTTAVWSYTGGGTSPTIRVQYREQWI